MRFGQRRSAAPPAGYTGGSRARKGPKPAPGQLDPNQLHHGPYSPPTLRQGDRATGRSTRSLPASNRQ
jgi:hypothetical protein